ncbi:unnamed protein product [Vitrella brassicaformis CCMP3155]|uniref:Protein kinase domain-containing protein n=1 Tax=Vitrella brassicaformis (strain CCMP3155) TaxID=1169540 RepID=A0A0G4FYU2_VITBC|nr:unnamed protein product [Vitrella brassicaformis CCMP3155]|eukprot:CEM20719.1 unnamed protein product [Vitrella brassicaformis CCMP3155]
MMIGGAPFAQYFPHPQLHPPLPVPFHYHYHGYHALGSNVPMHELVVVEEEEPEELKEKNLLERVIYGGIEEYTIKKVLQSCLYGKVCKGVGNVTTDDVAIKVLHKDLIGKKEKDRQLPETPLAEVFFARLLQGHPHVMSIREVFEDEKCHFVVSDLATGDDLLELLKKHKCGLPEEYARTFLRQATEGLAFLHSQGLAMQDFSLENCLLFLTPDGKYHVRICDPGQAVRFLMAPNGVEVPVDYRGCIGKKFRPPEVHREGIPYFASRVDSWCLGWSTFYLLFAIELFDNAHPTDHPRDDWRWPDFRAGHHERVFQRLGVQDRLSPAAKDFIMRLLQVEAPRRMSVQDALNHPFLRDASRETMDAIPEHLQRLRFDSNSSGSAGLSDRGSPPLISREDDAPEESGREDRRRATSDEQEKRHRARRLLQEVPLIPEKYNQYMHDLCRMDKPSGAILASAQQSGHMPLPHAHPHPHPHARYHPRLARVEEDAQAHPAPTPKAPKGASHADAGLMGRFAEQMKIQGPLVMAPKLGGIGGGRGAVLSPPPLGGHLPHHHHHQQPHHLRHQQQQNEGLPRTASWMSQGSQGGGQGGQAMQPHNSYQSTMQQQHQGGLHATWNVPRTTNALPMPPARREPQSPPQMPYGGRFFAAHSLPPAAGMLMPHQHQQYQQYQFQQQQHQQQQQQRQYPQHATHSHPQQIPPQVPRGFPLPQMVHTYHPLSHPQPQPTPGPSHSHSLTDSPASVVQRILVASNKTAGAALTTQTTTVPQKSDHNALLPPRPASRPGIVHAEQAVGVELPVGDLPIEHDVQQQQQQQRPSLSFEGGQDTTTSSGSAGSRPRRVAARSGSPPAIRMGAPRVGAGGGGGRPTQSKARNLSPLDLTRTGTGTRPKTKAPQLLLPGGAGARGSPPPPDTKAGKRTANLPSPVAAQRRAMSPPAAGGNRPAAAVANNRSPSAFPVPGRGTIGGRAAVREGGGALGRRMLPFPSPGTNPPMTRGTLGAPPMSRLHGGITGGGGGGGDSPFRFKGGAHRGSSPAPRYPTPLRRREQPDSHTQKSPSSGAKTTARHKGHQQPKSPTNKKRLPAPGGERERLAAATAAATAAAAAALVPRGLDGRGGGAGGSGDKSISAPVVEQGTMSRGVGGGAAGAAAAAGGQGVGERGVDGAGLPQRLIWEAPFIQAAPEPASSTAGVTFQTRQFPHAHATNHPHLHPQHYAMPVTAAPAPAATAATASVGQIGPQALPRSITPFVGHRPGHAQIHMAQNLMRCVSPLPVSSARLHHGGGYIGVAPGPLGARVPQYMTTTTTTTTRNVPTASQHRAVSPLSERMTASRPAGVLFQPPFMGPMRQQR